MRRAGRFATLEDWTERCIRSGHPTPWLLFEFASACGERGQTDRALRLLDEHLLAEDAGVPRLILLRAHILRGLLLYDAGRYAELDKAVQALKSLKRTSVSPSVRAESLRLEASWHASRGDLATAEATARKAAALRETLGDPHNTAFAQLDVSRYQMMRSDPAGVVVSISRALQVLDREGAPAPLSAAYNNLGAALHLQGDFERALDAFARALRAARLGSAVHLEAMILMGEADLFSDLGMAFQAGELYEQGLALATQLDRSDLVAYGCLQTAALHRRSGTPSIAAEWLKRAASAEGRADTSAAHSLELAALEVLVSPPKALRRLHRLTEKPAALAPAERARALYLKARCTQALEGETAAQPAYAACLDWIARSATEQVVASELRPDLDARRLIESQFATHPTARRLLERVRAIEAHASLYDPQARAKAQGAPIEFLALGQSTIRVAGRRSDGLKPLSREVGFYLLDAGSVERDTLVETFWPEHSPGRQTANLHMAVYQLRQLLGKDSLALEGTSYSLSPLRGLEYDVRRFERSATIAERLPAGDPRRMFALTEAVNSYGGAFLPEFDSGWALVRRRQLQSRYLDLLITGAEESLTRNQVARAAQLLREAVAHEPLRDDLHEQLMHALHRMGRRNEIVELYQQYVRALSDDLGLDPPDRLRELYTRLIS